MPTEILLLLLYGLLNYICEVTKLKVENSSSSTFESSVITLLINFDLNKEICVRMGIF